MHAPHRHRARTAQAQVQRDIDKGMTSAETRVAYSGLNSW
jgi:hypothetical protein